MSNFYQYGLDRELVLDVETTGLSTRLGDRVVEIAVVELFDGKPSGNEFHTYVNPARSVGYSFQFHGLSDNFLQYQPYFENICDDMLVFMQDTTIVAHNASFDIGFLKYELGLLDFDLPTIDVVDTLTLARQKFGTNTSNLLDGLCARFGLGGRQNGVHSALDDARLLADIYYKLKYEYYY